jgi:hypothetical protein
MQTLHKWHCRESLFEIGSRVLLPSLIDNDIVTVSINKSWVKNQNICGAKQMWWRVPSHTIHLPLAGWSTP